MPSEDPCSYRYSYDNVSYDKTFYSSFPLQNFTTLENGVTHLLLPP